MDTTTEPLSRSLTILADGEPVTGRSRAWLTGGERLALFPYLFTLRLWNLPEDGYLALSRCRSVSVLSGGAELVIGAAAGTVRHTTPQGVVTTVCFSPGLPLWEAPVSLSVEAGASVADTVQQLLLSSGTGIRLLSSEGLDAAFARPQAFCGRAAECIEEALSRAGARACIVPSGLCAVPASGVPVSMTLDEEDLLSAPEFPDAGTRGLSRSVTPQAGQRDCPRRFAPDIFRNCRTVPDVQMILRTHAAGWTLGKCVRAVWEGDSYTGLICERSYDLDTGDGPWRTELLLEPGP